MKACIFATLLFTLLSGLVCLELSQEWSLFKTAYSKTYSNWTEEKYRIKIYFANKRYIKEHNARAASGVHSFTLAMNRFGDLTLQEFRQRMNGFKSKLSSPWLKGVKYVRKKNIDIPKQVDWRTQGYVTQVKDQGDCGSCWAFSATGSLEGQLYRFTGKQVFLSEQNLVDCSSLLGNQGCNGGHVRNAFAYIASNNGIDDNGTYPYTARTGSCKYDEDYVAASVAGFVELPEGNEEFLQEAVAAVGPISVAIDASSESFQFYNGGIYNEADCSSDSLNHAVLIVGYGTEQTGKPYWLVKNSFGPSWGEDGYIRMSRNSDNQCGIASRATYPIYTDPFS